MWMLPTFGLYEFKILGVAQDDIPKFFRIIKDLESEMYDKIQSGKYKKMILVHDFE